MDEREKELVQQALNGNSSAFKELVLPYRQSLLHLAYRMTGNMEEAMDIAQETILRCFQYLHRFDPEKTFRHWLFQIALNLSHDARRKKSVEQKYLKEFSNSDNRLIYCLILIISGKVLD
jgi:RNA polymerase sigma-70 factor (ECF subfamily)